jgi:ubiquinone/menaquinone biosynthesis C-methylase UbiE
MVERACRAARESNAQNVTFVEASAERLPVAEATIDVVLTNGIFNLNPARKAIFSEIARVLRPGAPAYAAELILREAAAPQKTIDPADWFA